MVTKIYALMDGITCLYVGKTKNSLSLRANNHKHKKSKCYTKYIPDDIQWTIELIEECDNSIVRLREQYWYDTLEPLYNKNRPGQTGAESSKAYREKHKEQTIAYFKIYRQNNKEKRNARQRAWRKAKKLNTPN